MEGFTPVRKTKTNLHTKNRMNKIRINEALKLSGGIIGLSQDSIKSMVAAPMFELGINFKPLSEDEYRWCHQNLMREPHEPMFMPFDTIAVHFTDINPKTREEAKNNPPSSFQDHFANDDYWEKSESTMWFSRHYGASTVIECAQLISLDKKKFMLRIGMKDLRTSENADGGINADCNIILRSFTEVGTSHFMSISDRDKKLITNKPENKVSINEFASMCESQCGVAISVLMTLCYNVMSPANAVLKVTPDPKGRSVEWVKAREHYLILNRKQAAALRDSKRGPTDHEIMRAAHWRRAHLRRLMSDRYGKNKGKLIHVRQAWVGPEEWTGSDGKIYKLSNFNHTSETKTNGGIGGQ